MSDIVSTAVGTRGSTAAAQDHTLASSTIYRLCEEVIALREMNARQHQLFERALRDMRSELQASFNTFAADTQRAYQQLRQEFHGDKRVSLSLLHLLLEIGVDLQHLVRSRPASADGDGMTGWADAVAVQARKVEAALARQGIHPYNAAPGTAYNPALHERVGSRRVEGMDSYRVAEQVEPGLASQQPEFVLRRAKVLVSE